MYGGRISKTCETITPGARDEQKYIRTNVETKRNIQHLPPTCVVRGEVKNVKKKSITYHSITKSEQSQKSKRIFSVCVFDPPPHLPACVTHPCITNITQVAKVITDQLTSAKLPPDARATTSATLNNTRAVQGSRLARI